ncbi:MAG: hypothetical protein R3C03_11090 [Pirellulaceae bacterium]
MANISRNSVQKLAWKYRLGAVFWLIVSMLAWYYIFGGLIEKPFAKIYLGALSVFTFINCIQAYLRAIDFAEFTTPDGQFAIPMHVEGQPRDALTLVTGRMACHFLPLVSTGRRRIALILDRGQLIAIPGRHVHFSEFNALLSLWFLMIVPFGWLIYPFIVIFVVLFAWMDQLTIKKIAFVHKVDEADLESNLPPISVAEEPIVGHDHLGRRLFISFPEQAVQHCFHYHQRDESQVEQFIREYTASVNFARNNLDVVPCLNCDHPVFENSRICQYCGLPTSAESPYSNHMLIRLRADDSLPPVCYKCGVELNRPQLPYEPHSVRQRKRERSKAYSPFSLTLHLFGLIPFIGLPVKFMGKLLYSQTGQKSLPAGNTPSGLKKLHAHSELPQCDSCIAESGVPLIDTADEHKFVVHREFGRLTIKENRNHSKSLKMIEDSMIG